MSRLERSRLALGSMEYSAVTQPSPSGTWGGVRSSTEAVHSTWVLPQRMRQEPSANRLTFGMISMGRSAS